MKVLFRVLIIAVLFLPSIAFSFPRFALRMNDSCQGCHVNPTGGGLRNVDGWYYGKYPMSMISPREKDFSQSPQLNQNVIIGADFRTQFIYSGEQKKTDFQEMTGSLYLGMELSEKISLYSRYDFVQGNWEGYAIARILPLRGYIKAGSYTPNFGIRLDDHTAYTRGGDHSILSSAGKKGLIYNSFYTETGVEVGISPHRVLNITASVGKPNTRFGYFQADPTYTARIEGTPSIGEINFLAGASYASIKLVDPNNIFPPKYMDTRIYGFFGGVGYRAFSLLGEFDTAQDYQAIGIKSNALMIEGTYEIMVGLEAMVRYDQFDLDTKIEKDEVSHLILGLNYFPYSFIEIMPQYRIYSENPKIDNDSFILQFHFWY